VVVVLVDGDPVRASACKFKAGMDGLAAAALSKMVIPDGRDWSGLMGMNCEDLWGDGGEEAASKLNRLINTNEGVAALYFMWIRVFVA